MYEPEHDGSLEDYAAGYRSGVSPQLLRPIRTEADARAAAIRSRLLRAVDAMRSSGALDRELALELIAQIEGATA